MQKLEIHPFSEEFRAESAGLLTDRLEASRFWPRRGSRPTVYRMFRAIP